MMEKYKLDYIKQVHEDLKKKRIEFRDKVPYEKMNDRDKMFALIGKIEALTDVLLLTEYGWEPDQIEKLTTRFVNGALDL